MHLEVRQQKLKAYIGAENAVNWSGNPVKKEDEIEILMKFHKMWKFLSQNYQIYGYGEFFEC